MPGAGDLLEVVFYRDSRSRLSSIFASGHAGFGEEGQDVVCAAVSALLQAAWLGLRDHAKVSPAAQAEKGHFRLSWPEESRADDGVRAIVGTAALAVEALARQYPAHVRFILREQP